jgi:enoyl-[acyl-carrier protein] reductase III
MSGSVHIDLRGKTALVTGGSRGIGRAIAIELGRAGARVAINYLRNRAAAEETAQAIRSLGAEPLLLKANVAEVEHLDRLFAQLKEAFGHLDILVSNAASGVLKPATEITAKHFDWTMSTNARALLGLVQQALSLMDGRRGRVIAISSLGAERAIPYYTAVGASKGALESLVRHLALELGPRGLRINLVSPGVVDTDALQHFPNRDRMLEFSQRHTPAGRLTTPEDVGRVVAWLASDDAEMIHGQTIVVDGGYSIVAWP